MTTTAKAVKAVTTKATKVYKARARRIVVKAAKTQLSANCANALYNANYSNNFATLIATLRATA